MGLSGSGISFSGLGSGIDTESIINQLLQLERRPIARLQTDQLLLKTKLAAIDQYKSVLGTLKSKVIELNTAAAFNPMKAVSSKPEVASLLATSTSLPGTYNLAVSKLAQAGKISTSAQTDATSALGLSGTILINGKDIEVEASDTLTSLAGKINQSGAAVTASIINGGTGNVYLTLTAKDSGEASEIAVSEVGGGTVLSSLGLVTGSASIRMPTTNGALSLLFDNSTDTIESQLGVTGTGTVTINGQAVAIDFSTDSLADIAANINAAGAGVTATVESVTVGSSTKQQLKIVGATTPTFVDANGVLENLGILQRAFGNEMIVAQDAEYELDGIAFTSSTNTITDVIPGATLTLLKANETTPETSTLTITRDTAAITTKVQDLATSYNAVLDFLKQAAFFDSETLESGPLFGDSAVEAAQTQLLNGLLASPAGVDGAYANLLAIGVDFDSSGRMLVDNTKLENAIGADLDNVRALFSEVGRIADPNVKFVSATNKTKVSGLVGYEVVVTQLATRGEMTAGAAYTSASTEVETLTFDGQLFGNSDYQISFSVGSTLDDVIAEINSDARLKDLVVASKSGDTLVLTSKKYGTPGSFTVVSDKDANGSNTGIGTTVVEADGLDVEGTIAGESATGTGQFLTGNSGNAKTDGLTIQITGGALGSRGNLIYSKGAAAVLEDVLDGALDYVNGFVTAGSKATQDQIDDIDDQIEAIQQRIRDREQYLRRVFAAMEDAVTRLRSQSAQLSSILAALPQRSGLQL